MKIKSSVYLLAIAVSLLLTTSLSAQQTADEFGELGRQQDYQGDKEGALHSFGECLRLDPNNWYCYARRAGLYRQKKDYAAALADYTQSIRIKPDDDSGYSHRAEIYHANLKNYDAAIADYLMVLKLLPGDSTYALIADVYADKKDYDNALVNITQAIKLNPNRYYYYSARAGFYAAKEEYAKAAEDYSNAIVSDSSPNAAYYAGRSKAYCLLGETALAAADEQKARNLGSSDAVACQPSTAQDKTIISKKPVVKLVVVSEAERILQLQRLNESTYYQALKDAPSQSAPSEYRGKALAKYFDSLANSHRTEEENGQIILSKLKELADIDFYAAFTAVISTNYDANRINAVLGRMPVEQSAAIRQLGGWYSANYDLERSNQAKKLYPADLPPPGFGWGKTVSSNANPKAAVISPPKAGSVDGAMSGKSSDLIALAVKQMAANDSAGAIRSFDECLRLTPNNVYCHSMRANIFFQTGEYDKALPDLDEAVRLNPEYDGEYFLRGILYTKKKNSAAAIKDLTKAIELAEGYKENHPEYYWQRAIAYLDADKLSEALTDLNKAVTLDPENYLYYFERALVFVNLHDNPNAIADYRKTLQLNPQLEQARKALKLLGAEP